MNFSKAELVQYRLSRAKEAFKDAEILTVSKSWNAAANRLYYACFYAVSAYLALHDIETTSPPVKSKIYNRSLQSLLLFIGGENNCSLLSLSDWDPLCLLGKHWELIKLDLFEFFSP